MTGELFAVLKEHSLLGALMAPGAFDAAAFELGARRALDDAAITSLILTARAEGLLGGLPQAALASYLSGLLIGAEVRGGLAGGEANGAITLIGAAHLSDLYARAFALAGLPAPARQDSAEAAAAGLWRLARALPAT
jgi:2-dehydro-3-deoxygalactonokinase